MQCSLLLFLLVVLQLPRVAADSETDCEASEGFSKSSGERLRIAVDSETLPTDRGASESFSESSGEKLR